MVGIAAEWPFLSQPGYTGPLVGTLGGADISWLVGWFTAAIAYLLLSAFTPGTAATGGRSPRPPTARRHRQDQRAAALSADP